MAKANISVIKRHHDDINQASADKQYKWHQHQWQSISSNGIRKQSAAKIMKERKWRNGVAYQ